jgi:hypothetical protein
MTPEEAQEAVELSLQDFLAKGDIYLLERNVSERAITHKLAMYLQDRVEDRHREEDLSVDCEYNRNAQLGEDAKKLLPMVQQKREAALLGKSAAEVGEETLKGYATFPDIIVHHRGENSRNTIVIEVKKEGSDVGDDYDGEKLISFTHPERGYRYTLGAFIKLGTGGRAGEYSITWFRGGKRL